MIKTITVIALFIVLASCQTDTYGKKRPEDLVSRDTLVMVLTELSLIESHIQDTYIHVGVFKDVMKRSGDLILSKYGLTSSRFESTVDYYGTRQEELESIYNQVLDSLNKEASRLPDESFRVPDTSRSLLLQGLPGSPR